VGEGGGGGGGGVSRSVEIRVMVFYSSELINFTTKNICRKSGITISIMKNILTPEKILKKSL